MSIRVLVTSLKSGYSDLQHEEECFRRVKESDFFTCNVLLHQFRVAFSPRRRLTVSLCCL